MNDDNGATETATGWERVVRPTPPAVFACGVVYRPSVSPRVKATLCETRLLRLKLVASLKSNLPT